MTNLCFYFQVHQPWRLRHYRYVEVGHNHDYFDHDKNAQVMRKVADKCYLPMNNLLLDLISDLDGSFKASFSISGVFLQQAEEYAPEVIHSFKRLIETGCVEVLSETSHHSLTSLFSPEEFVEQVNIHRELCSRLLKTPGKTFRNTELITSNAIASEVAKMGYRAMLMEGADRVLGWRSPLFGYHLKNSPNLLMLLKNYRLSDDIAFRFSDRGWAEWPLTSEKFTHWLKMIELENPVSAKGQDPFVGLFMDYETFGEHQWKSTGIFDFMRALPLRLLDTGSVRFVTPSEAAETMQPSAELDVHSPVSWADIERDLSAWVGNPIQDSAIRAIYRLEGAVKKTKDASLIETWRRLTTSDHFYYMCTKYFADGDVHKYFNPYESPYDAHIYFMNTVADLEQRLGLAPVEDEERIPA
ncbi:MAG: glycoside hydrolase family 57 protein [Bdellovibrionota bacterium]